MVQYKWLEKFQWRRLLFQYPTAWLSLVRWSILWTVSRQRPSVSSVLCGQHCHNHDAKKSTCFDTHVVSASFSWHCWKWLLSESENGSCAIRLHACAAPRLSLYIWAWLGYETSLSRQILQCSIVIDQSIVSAWQTRSIWRGPVSSLIFYKSSKGFIQTVQTLVRAELRKYGWIRRNICLCLILKLGILL